MLLGFFLLKKISVGIILAQKKSCLQTPRIIMVQTKN